ncbi:MAG: Tm-1-like ATP-binding domain-containing protein [Verrucomicrobiota bacterium]
MSNPKILIIGAFDTKGEEHAFLRERILENGCEVLTMNFGVMGTTTLFDVDFESWDVASSGGEALAALQEMGDRGEAMKTMSFGAAYQAEQLCKDGAIQGIIGMGGGGGTSVISAAMRALPIEIPKVCVSTMAGGDVSAFVGVSNLTMIPAIVDVAGLNRISRTVFTQAAGAICGMVRAEVPAAADEKPIIAASMFGNTTECVTACQKALEQNGYEVLVFHATGTGGKTMESLADQQLLAGVLDITTTEWADEVCGGVLSAGPNRLSAPGRNGIPHLVVPGCIDMANFGPIDAVPAEYRESGRNLYEWNPAVTLMRTNIEENRRIGEIFAEKLNAATGPVAVLLPLGGVSILDGGGERFCDREADQAMFDALKSNLRDDIRVEEIDAKINDAEFSKIAVEMMLELLASAS